MTPDEMIAVIAAHRDGKKIEKRLSELGGKWTEAREPRWNFSDWEYRVAPEPMDVWVNVYPGHNSSGYSTKAEADIAALADRIRCVHMREVTETE